MRAIAACQFEIKRFEAWRYAVTAFLAGVVVSLTLWSIDRPVAWPQGGVLALLLVALMATFFGRSLLRTHVISLHWDGRHWQVRHAGSTEQNSKSGDLSVAVDLGSWMLLRLVPQGAGRWPRATWLPVQRRGMEAQWHSLRCAVYSPRLARNAVQDAGAAGDL